MVFPNLNLGYLEYHPKSGKPPLKYSLNVGTNTIGTSLTSDIRIKFKNQETEPILCVIDVKDNGVAILEGKSEHPVLFNTNKLNKTHILKNKDRFTVGGKEFYYVNNNVAPMEFANSIKTRKRQSVMPSFKMKPTSQISVSTKANNKYNRRSFSAVKLNNKIDTVRRSCCSALPDKQRRRLHEWESIQTPNVVAGKSLNVYDMATSVRRSLFLKNKGGTSMELRKSSRKSSQSVVSNTNIEDLYSPTQSSSVRTPTPRGVKRIHEPNSNSMIKLYKRRKHSENHLVFNLSISSETTYESMETELDKVNRSSSVSTSRDEESTFIDALSELISTSQMNMEKSFETPLNRSDVKKSLRTPKVQKSPLNDLSDVRGIKKILRTPKVQKSPLNDLTDVRGMKKIFKTPKVQKSPLNDLTEVKGVKRFLRTPKIQKSPLNDLRRVEGVKKLLRTPKVQKSPKNDLTNVHGVKKLLRTPKIQKSPLNDLANVVRVKKIFKTPKAQKSPLNDLTDVRGVKKMLASPKVQKSPLNDLREVKGVKKLMRTPKIQQSPLNDLTDVSGVKKIMKTPKPLNSPLNDLSDVKGVKKLLRTPKVRKAPLNDLTDVSGVKRLLRTPKIQKSPVNDLINISGVETIFGTPKIQNFPMNDLKEVKKKLKPQKVQKSPLNDLTDVRGVKRIMRSPKIQKQPLNDLTDVEGVGELFNSPKETIREKEIQQNDNNETTKISKKTNLHSNKSESKTRDSPKEDAETPQPRSMRTRRKKIEDNPIEENERPQKRIVRGRKRKNTVEEPEDVSEISVGSPHKETVNQKEDENGNENVEMSEKRNVRSQRRRNAAKEIKEANIESPTVLEDTKKPQKRNVRGRKKENNEEELENANEEETGSDQTQNATVEVLEKRNVRNLRKKAVKEANQSNVETSVEEKTDAEDTKKPQKRNLRVRKRVNTVEEQSQGDLEKSNENIEKSIARNVRSRRKKNEIEQIELNGTDTSDTGKLPKRNVRGQKKNDTVESNQTDVESPKVETNKPQKRNLRGQKKKNNVAETAQSDVENDDEGSSEKSGRMATRNKKKNITSEIEVPNEPKKTSRGNRRKGPEEASTVDETPQTTAKSKKAAKVVAKTESLGGSNEEVESLAVRRTRRGRGVKQPS